MLLPREIGTRMQHGRPTIKLYSRDGCALCARGYVYVYVLRLAYKYWRLAILPTAQFSHARSRALSRARSDLQRENYDRDSNERDTTLYTRIFRIPVVVSLRSVIRTDREHRLFSLARSPRRSSLATPVPRSLSARIFR